MVPKKQNSKPEISYKTIHSPLSSYVAGVYNTLLSVIQGVSLGGIFYIMSTKALNPILLIRVLAVIMIVGLIWDRYVSNNQYSGWTLTHLDTIIPFGLCFFQFLLIISISESYSCFFSAIGLVALCGSIAYWNAEKRTTGSPQSSFYQLMREHYFPEMENDMFMKMLKENRHFKADTKDESYEKFIKIYSSEINKFEGHEKKLFFWIAVSCFLVAAAMLILDKLFFCIPEISKETIGILSVVEIVILSWYLFCKNLRLWLVEATLKLDLKTFEKYKYLFQ